MRIIALYLILAFPAISLTISGNDNVPDGDIKAAVLGLSENTQSEAILALYDLRGYLDAQVDINGDEVVVNEGQRYLLGEIRLSGDSDITQMGAFSSASVSVSYSP